MAYSSISSLQSTQRRTSTSNRRVIICRIYCRRHRRLCHVRQRKQLLLLMCLRIVAMETTLKEAGIF